MGFINIATGIWRREVTSSPQPRLAELIILPRHFGGQQAPALAVFPWGTYHLVAADAYGKHKLAAGHAGGNHNHDAPLCNKNHLAIAAVAGQTHKLTAAAFWRTVGNAMPEHARMDTAREPSVASMNMLRNACHTHSPR